MLNTKIQRERSRQIGKQLKISIVSAALRSLSRQFALIDTVLVKRLLFVRVVLVGYSSMAVSMCFFASLATHKLLLVRVASCKSQSVTLCQTKLRVQIRQPKSTRPLRMRSVRCVPFDIRNR